MENNSSVLDEVAASGIEKDYFSFTVDLAISIVYAVIEIFGLAGNGLVIFAVLSERRLRNNYYLVVSQLALCDIALLLSSVIEWQMLPWGYDFLATHWETVCKVWLTLHNWFYTSEIYFLAFIGVLRYKTVVKPFSHPMSRKRLFCIVLLIYFFALLLQVPYFLSLRRVGNLCLENWYGIFRYDLYAYSLPFVLFFIPIMSLALLYAKLCRSLFIHSKDIQQLCTVSLSNSREDFTAASMAKVKQARNAKAVVTSMIIVVVFAVSNIPMQVQRFILLLTKKYNVINGFWITALFYFGSSCVNPFIYALCDKSLFRGLIKKLKIACCKKTKTVQTLDGPGEE